MAGVCLQHVSADRHFFLPSSPPRHLPLLLLQPGSQGAANYTALVTLTAREVHEAMPGSQVSVDIPWSPYDIDSRSYDWHGLAAAADLLFIMIYDTQSQVGCGGTCLL